MTTGHTPEQLVAEILGPGITVVPGSVSYTGAAVASGKFTGGSVIGINSGILLTTGSAANVTAANTSDNISANNGLAGDPDANRLAAASTFDATVLQFNFTSAGGGLFFNYVFGSEEYNEFVLGGFNDPAGTGHAWVGFDPPQGVMDF